MPTTTKLLRKFADHIETLEATASGELNLRDTPKLYNKLYRFYAKHGVTFTGDALVDYSLIVNYLNEDLYSDF